ncbi:MAG: hypothetical protein KME25_33530 [Symplocastrum torsivum CPER-KK1]|uniref:Uncharacterized protein n=1 Tax=Symplocastrum torsivum CPER-KK1 TaxID=450513 RepID=A0A951PV75_9CYAN|nr:hypothetical protein [Symplocastrum torsivum CPER-KK1]
MTNPLTLVKKLDKPSVAAHPKRRQIKSRQQRRQEERDRVKANKLNRKKNDLLSA